MAANCDIYVYPVDELWMAAIYSDGTKIVAFGGFGSPSEAIEQAKEDLPTCGCSGHNTPVILQSEAQLPP